MQNLLLSIVLFFLACGVKSGGASQIVDGSTSNVSPHSNSCKEYEGSWEVKTYEGASLESEIVCDGVPCEGGNWEGYIRMSCTGDEPSGTVTLGFSSLPPPGKASRAPLEIAVNDKDATLSYVDQR